MPCFGKSGTVRILAFSGSISILSSPNRETRKPACRREHLGLHLIHACSRRTAPDRQLEAHQGLGVPFGQHLDATVVEVARPAGHTLAFGGFVHEVAKPHAGDTPRDHVPSGNQHPQRLWKSPRPFRSGRPRLYRAEAASVSRSRPRGGAPRSSFL